LVIVASAIGALLFAGTALPRFGAPAAIWTTVPTEFFTVGGAELRRILPLFRPIMRVVLVLLVPLPRSVEVALALLSVMLRAMLLHLGCGVRDRAEARDDRAEDAARQKPHHRPARPAAHDSPRENVELRIVHGRNLLIVELPWHPQWSGAGRFTSPRRDRGSRPG
jgi:hypothetical protein